MQLCYLGIFFQLIYQNVNSVTSLNYIFLVKFEQMQTETISVISGIYTDQTIKARTVKSHFLTYAEAESLKSDKERTVFFFLLLSFRPSVHLLIPLYPFQGHGVVCACPSYCWAKAG